MFIKFLFSDWEIEHLKGRLLVFKPNDER